MQCYASENIDLTMVFLECSFIVLHKKVAKRLPNFLSKIRVPMRLCSIKQSKNLFHIGFLLLFSQMGIYL